MNKTAKTIICVLSILCLVLGGLLTPGLTTTAFAADSTPLSGSCGKDGANVLWVLDPDTGVLTISGNGEMEDYASIVSSPWYHNTAIEHVVVEEGVRSIGDYAFLMTSSITDVSLPKGLTRIGSMAFLSCTGLTDCKLPEQLNSIGDMAFTGTAISELTLPNGLVSIGENAFSHCDKLTQVTIPASVTEIAVGILNACKALETITVDAANPNYCDQDGILFSKDGTVLLQYPAGRAETSYAVPAGVTEIAENAFTGCVKLVEVDVSDGVLEIGQAAFAESSSIAKVSLPGTLTTVYNRAFSDCTSLTEVTIPDSVTNIGAYQFSGCVSLEKVTIGSGLAMLSRGMFMRCTALAEVTIPETVETIEEGVFRGCESLETVTVLNPDCKIYDAADTLSSQAVLVRGWAGSTAETYSETYGYAFEALPTLTENPFADVPADSFYADAVLWAVSHNPQITVGTGKTTFSPNSTCTRAQAVTFLWRAMGQSEPIETDNPFTDVPSDDYYNKAVLWAVEKGITVGTSDTTFSPAAACTRGQIVTFLWRAAGSPDPTTTECKFTDVKAGAYYEKAVLWAAETGVTSGTSATTFSPDKVCTRAEIVTFLYRDFAE